MAHTDTQTPDELARYFFVRTTLGIAVVITAATVVMFMGH